MRPRLVPRMGNTGGTCSTCGLASFNEAAVGTADGPGMALRCSTSGRSFNEAAVGTADGPNGQPRSASCRHGFNEAAVGTADGQAWPRKDQRRLQPASMRPRLVPRMGTGRCSTTPPTATCFNEAAVGTADGREMRCVRKLEFPGFNEAAVGTADGQGLTWLFVLRLDASMRPRLVPRMGAIGRESGPSTSTSFNEAAVGTADGHHQN